MQYAPVHTLNFGCGFRVLYYNFTVYQTIDMKEKKYPLTRQSKNIFISLVLPKADIRAV